MMRLAIVLVVVAGCAKSTTDLYPFPCAEDGTCPVDGEIRGLVCDGNFGCVLQCDVESAMGCTGMVDGQPFANGKLLRCEDFAATSTPICIQTCTAPSDCNPSYTCQNERCVLED